jgi:hypothetical protein
LAAAHNLQDVEVVVAVSRIERLHSDGNQKITLPAVADAFAAGTAVKAKCK